MKQTVGLPVPKGYQANTLVLPVKHLRWPGYPGLPVIEVFFWAPCHCCSAAGGSWREARRCRFKGWHVAQYRVSAGVRWRGGCRGATLIRLVIHRTSTEGVAW